MDARSGQNAVAGGQWQLALGSEGAVTPGLSGEAKTVLLHYNSAQCREDLEVNAISTGNKCNISSHVSYTSFHFI